MKNFTDQMNSGNRFLDECLADASNPELQAAAEVIESAINWNGGRISNPELGSTAHFLAGLEKSGIQAIRTGMETTLASPDAPSGLINLASGDIRLDQNAINNPFHNGAMAFERQIPVLQNRRLRLQQSLGKR